MSAKIKSVGNKIIENVDKVGMVIGFFAPMAVLAGDQSLLRVTLGEFEQVIRAPGLPKIDSLKWHFEKYGRASVVSSATLAAFGIVTDFVYPNKWSKIATKVALGSIVGTVAALIVMSSTRSGGGGGYPGNDGSSVYTNLNNVANYSYLNN